MFGRYGTDALNYVLFALVLVLIIINSFMNEFIIYFITLIIMAIYFLRPFSKNIYARRKENEWLLKLVRPITRRFKKIRKQSTEKNHKIFECPKCHQFVRVPKGKGKVEVSCPKCEHRFEKRT